jgi:hypothetical protein
MGEIAFLDRKGGGTHVRMAFDTGRLAALENDEAPPEGEEEDRDEDV